MGKLTWRTLTDEEVRKLPLMPFHLISSESSKNSTQTSQGNSDTQSPNSSTAAGGKMTVTQQVAESLKTADLSRTNRAGVASALGMMDTTLSRRLRVEGTTFTLLLGEERKRRIAEAQG